MILTTQNVFKDNDAIGFFTKNEFKAYVSSLNEYALDNLRELISAVNTGKMMPVISIHVSEKGKFFIVRASYHTLLAPYKVIYFEGLEDLLNHGKLYNIQLSLDGMMEEANKE